MITTKEPTMGRTAINVREIIITMADSIIGEPAIDTRIIQPTMKETDSRGQDSRYDNYPQRNENYAIYPQQRQNNNTQRDNDYYRENNYDYPKQELIRESDMEF